MSEGVNVDKHKEVGNSAPRKGATVENLRELGNEAVRNEKYEEAILHYTYAIKLDPKNFLLYSNRSLAFLKIQQYYFALEDAYETVRLNPTWAKGYFRKGEIEYATYHYTEAFDSYQRALQLQPDDIVIASAIARTRYELKKDLKADAQIPWVGAGVGIVLGVIIVIADYVCTRNPTLTHPVLMAILTISIAMLGYGIAKACRYSVKWQRDALLEKPLGLVKEQEQVKNPESDVKTQVSHKYSKSQGRLRYKKGKS